MEFKIAELKESELKKIQELEKELNISLVAYSNRKILKVKKSLS